ncbi:MAG: hypothetical protein AAF439_13515 [Pseudomonadota bacterium]
MRQTHSPHPWWSRVLYLCYGAVALAGAVYAVTEGQNQFAIIAGGIGAVLIWKATQKAR